MTETSVIKCDASFDGDCAGAVEIDSAQTVVWAEYEHEDAHLHICPSCADRFEVVFKNARIRGDWMDVALKHVDEDYEYASIQPPSRVDPEERKPWATHGMAVSKLIDETDSYPEYEHSQEGWRFHVSDHAGVVVLGRHKETPTVILEPEEHPTAFEVRESHAGYSFDSIAVEEGIDVERVARR